VIKLVVALDNMKHSTQKSVVLMLLGMALVDLALPGFCQSEQVELPLTFTQRTEALRPTESQAEENRPSSLPAEGPEDDCFCCCSHVQTTPISSIGPAIPAGDLDRIEIKIQRPLFPRNLFRPPRSV